jgi:hypothetical protein
MSVPTDAFDAFPSDWPAPDPGLTPAPLASGAAASPTTARDTRRATDRVVVIVLVVRPSILKMRTFVRTVQSDRSAVEIRFESSRRAEFP